MSRAYRACRPKRLLFLEKFSNCSYGRRRNRSSEETLTAFYLPVGLRPSLSRPFFSPVLLALAHLSHRGGRHDINGRGVPGGASAPWLPTPKSEEEGRVGVREGHRSPKTRKSLYPSPLTRTSKPLFNNRGLCTRHLIERATIRRIISLRILVEVKSRPTQLRLVEDFALGDPGTGQARRESL